MLIILGVSVMVIVPRTLTIKRLVALPPATVPKVVWHTSQNRQMNQTVQQTDQHVVTFVLQK